MKLVVDNLDVVGRRMKARVDRMRREFRQILEDTAAEIVRRTKAGRGVDGKFFAPYSERWKRVRQKAGRQVSRPDLTFSGDMLSSIVTRVRPTSENVIEGEIYFADSLQADKARGNHELRPFFGLSQRQRREIIERLRKVR